jgi:hypothetical protein
MSSAEPSVELVRLELGFGSYELAPAECGELAGLLRRRAGEPQPGDAAAAAQQLESLLTEGRAPAAAVTESELDAIADAAWTWLEQVGAAGLPPRVLVLLDALRARHAHD